MNTPPVQPPKTDLHARREELRMRSEALRQSLAIRSQRARPAFHAADRVNEGLQWMRQHREWVGVAAAAVLGSLAVRPRLLMRLGPRLYTAWTLAQRAQPLLRMFMRR